MKEPWHDRQEGTTDLNGYKRFESKVPFDGYLDRFECYLSNLSYYSYIFVQRTVGNKTVAAMLMEDGGTIARSGQRPVRVYANEDLKADLYSAETSQSAIFQIRIRRLDDG